LGESPFLLSCLPVGYFIVDELRNRLIEESLDRLEGKGTEADRGKKMNEYYMKRGRDEKKEKGKEKS
jgi:hypothetical protein